MLYLIATPIGNLKDISLRAIEIFNEIDVLLCEDTRQAGLLLKNLEIKNQPKLVSFYDEIEEQKIPYVLNLLKEGLQVGLISDAGTPAISDPGYKLVKKCRQENLEITAIPGPSAIINALVLSGLPTGRFCFIGFLPKKDSDRKKILEKYKEFDGTKVVYESPFRIEKLLNDLKTIYNNEVKVAMCREMTKKFEEVTLGNPDDILTGIKKEKNKGEFVVVFN